QGRGRHEDAVQEHETAQRLAGDVPLVKPVLARSLALAGRRRDARALLKEEAGTHASAYQRATVHVALEEPDRALACLERAGEERDPWMVWVKVDPML